MNGTPINVHQLMAHSPDLLAAWWNFRNHAVAGGSLGPHLGELVILRVAVHLGAWYEWASHVDRAQKNGMATQTIFETLRAQPDLPKSENLVLTAVDELMADRGIRPSTRAQLEKHYSTAQIMDVIARESVTHFGAAPIVLQMIAEAGVDAPFDPRDAGETMRGSVRLDGWSISGGIGTLQAQN